MAKHFIWISEAEATDLIGLSIKTLRKYVLQKKFPIAWTRVTPKAACFYNKPDIERLKTACAVLPPFKMKADIKPNSETLESRIGNDFAAHLIKKWEKRDAKKVLKE